MPNGDWAGPRPARAGGTSVTTGTVSFQVVRRSPTLVLSVLPPELSVMMGKRFAGCRRRERSRSPLVRRHGVRRTVLVQPTAPGGASGRRSSVRNAVSVVPMASGLRAARWGHQARELAPHRSGSTQQGNERTGRPPAKPQGPPVSNLCSTTLGTSARENRNAAVESAEGPRGGNGHADATSLSGE